MKRMWRMLLAAAVALSLTAAPAAAQERLPYESVMRIYALRESGDRLVGSAVCLQAGVLATAAGAIEEDDLYVLDAAGNALTIRDVVRKEGGLVLLAVDETLEALNQTGSGKTDGALRVLTASTGGAAAVAARPCGAMEWLGQPAVLIETEAPVLPGSPVLDAAGSLVGLTAAEWTEAENTWVVQCGPFSTDMTASGGWVKQGFSVNWAKGLLTVDVSEFMADKTGSCTVAVASADNPYYIWTTQDAEKGWEASFLLRPDRAYTVWVWYDAGGAAMPSRLGDGTEMTLKAPEAFVGYDYQDVSFRLGQLPAGTPEDSPLVAEPLAEVTREALLDPEKALFLQAESTYSVTEEVSFDMLLTLDTPEGWFFTLTGGFYLMPDLQQADVWHCDLSPLLREYLDNGSGTLTSGRYTLTTYYDGMQVSQLFFTLD